MARAPRNASGEAPLIQAHTIPGTNVVMSALTKRHEHAPKKKPYVFDADQVKDIAIALNLDLNILLTGPTGCGKTSVVAALAAELGRPLVRFNCDGETRVSNLRGMMKPASEDGVLTLRFSAGALASAMADGYWVLLDEIDAALPSVLFVLQPVLEEGNRQMHIPETGETVIAHPQFALFATGNTIGYRAQHRARHSGTNPMNGAFVDRFGCVIACDYPSREAEYLRIRAHVPADDMKDYIDGVCRVADQLRTDATFRSDFSTRRLIQWVRLIQAHEFDVLRAFDLAVARKFESPTDAKVAGEIVRRIFGYEKE